MTFRLSQKNFRELFYGSDFGFDDVKFFAYHDFYGKKEYVVDIVLQNAVYKGYRYEEIHTELCRFSDSWEDAQDGKRKIFYGNFEDPTADPEEVILPEKQWYVTNMIVNISRIFDIDIGEVKLTEDSMWFANNDTTDLMVPNKFFHRNVGDAVKV